MKQRERKDKRREEGKGREERQRMGCKEREGERKGGERTGDGVKGMDGKEMKNRICICISFKMKVLPKLSCVN